MSTRQPWRPPRAASAALPAAHEAIISHQARMAPSRGRLRGALSRREAIAAEVQHAMRGGTVKAVAGPAPIAVELSGSDGRVTARCAREAARSLAQHGFCVCTGGLDASVLADAAREATSLYRAKRMAPGGFTVGGAPVLGPGARAGGSGSRDDHVMWLHEYLTAVGGPERGDAQTLLALDSALSRFGEAVVHALTRCGTDAPLARAHDGTALLFNGRTDTMLACYPGKGAAYGPHIDNADGDGRDGIDCGRCFTLVFYLNVRWEERHGGALRIFTPQPDGSDASGGGDSGPRHDPRHDPIADSDGPKDARGCRRVVDILPHGGTFVLFRADRVVHEVRPALAERLAMTLWMYAGTEEQCTQLGKVGAPEPRGTAASYMVR